MVRSDEKGRRIIAAHSEMSSDKLSYAIIKDIGEPGLFHFDIQDAKKDLLDPAINGTVNVMRAIKAHAPSVRRVVVTSFAAMLNMKNHPKIYTENHWNPISREKAALNPADGYRGSKTFAEKAAWKFVEDEKPNFTLASINPPLVF
ncbi:flavonol reductase cinnamoyl- reductase [Fusarium avenaceum]|nr:flavonol reductase cinnamoyl- reductase [Fusarium avenaceum]